MRISFDGPGRGPKGPLARFLAALAGLALIALGLVFSLVFLAVAAAAGLVFWLYFRWKTRALREHLRARQKQAEEAEEAASAPPAEARGTIIDGEAVRVESEGEDREGRRVKGEG